MSIQHPRLHIAVGVILDQTAEKVLVARRPQHLHLGGLLEFPGGKLDPGETVRHALARELSEELNINVTSARPLIQIKHEYPDKAVLLDVWLVTGWSGMPAGREGQEIMWLQRSALAKSEFPEANRPIITAVNLPAVYGITPDLPVYDDGFFTGLKNNLENGLQLVQFRSKGLDRQSKHRVLREIYEICSEYGCRLLVNSTAGMTMPEYAHGLHLTSRELMGLESRPLGDGYLVAASCHDRIELEQACRIGIDFAVLSPVNKTASHENAEPIGWSGFSEFVQDCNIPVYALGGMKMADMEQAVSCGGQGVAMISGLLS